jgi:hypothetical protein
MGAKKNGTKVRQHTEDAIAVLDELLAAVRARAEQHSAELAAASARVQAEVDRANAQLRQQLTQTHGSLQEALADAQRAVGATVEATEIAVRNLADETGTRMRAALVEFEARRAEVTGSLDEGYAAATTMAADAEMQARGSAERVEREVQRALAQVDDLRARLDTEARRSEARTRALDEAQAAAVRELEDHGRVLRSQMESMFAAAPMVEAPINAPPPDPTTPAFAGEDVTNDQVPDWDLTKEEVAVDAGRPAADEASVREPAAAEAAAPPPVGEPDQWTGTSEIPGHAPDRTQHRPGTAVTFRTSRAWLHASVAHLARTAADGWMQVEVVHNASQGSAGQALRLTARDVVGTWEHLNVPGHASSGARPELTVDAKELLNALELDRYSNDPCELVLDNDLILGTTLVPGRAVTTPVPVGDPHKVERIELPAAGHCDLTLDTLLGRIVIPSRITSALRSRRAQDVDLMAFDGQPCLVARVPGPVPEVAATVITPLDPEGATHENVVADRRGSGDDAVNQLFGALSAHSSPDELVDIVTNGVGYARRRAAAHPALPASVIIELLRGGSEEIRSAAAANPSIPRDAIELAVKDDAPSVRAAVAGNPDVPATLLFQLVRDDSEDVRARVAGNPSIPPEMLLSLVEDPESGVRAAAAAHESCPVEHLRALAADGYPDVCASVARNPNCPPELLEELLGTVPEVVLSNPLTPEHVLVAGSQVVSARLRAAVAANPATPPRELQALARDSDPEVVRAVLSNPRAPANVQRRALRRGERGQTATEPRPT